ncbi:uncharacterized protein LOC144346467 [Saccoglossus kowalevskii]
MSDTEQAATEADVQGMLQRIKALELAVTQKDEEVAAAWADAEASSMEVKRLIALERETSKVSADSGTGMGKVVYMSPSRKLDRFHDKPEKASDLSVEDWIEDAQAVISSRRLDVSEQAAFLIEHLVGKARREILGRGDAVKSDPSKIFAILIRVFGDGDSLPQLQQQFFAYTQSDEEDIIACSLQLVCLYDRIVQLDSSFKPGRESQLKSRLAEAVRDDSLRMELRRLNADQPELSFFDARDQVIKLMGQRGKSLKAKREAAVREVLSDQSKSDGEVAALAQQVSMLSKQVDTLTSMVQKFVKPENRSPVSTDNKPRCWTCNSPDHLNRDCPKRKSKPKPKPQDLN